MSCSSCKSITHNTDACYLARLSLGLKTDGSAIVGSLDGVGITPIYLRPAVRALETNTSLKFDPNIRALVFENEKSKNGKGTADSVTAQEILAGALISELGGVATLVDTGLASVRQNGNDLELAFIVPTPIESGEISAGFITYVATPNAGSGNYKLIQPTVGGSSDTVLVGHPNGGIEFVTPITSPIIIPSGSLTSAGNFSGTPAVSSGTWRYQEMGTSQTITNGSGSDVEVRLSFRFSLTTAGSHSGVYATLVNGGSDFKTTFVEGGNTIKQEGYPAGYAEYIVKLAPNQKCQFKFGAYTNAAGSMVAIIGAVDEGGNTVSLPVITIRRQV